MTRTQRFVGVMIGAGFASLAATVRADQWDQRTYMTFHRPVELPGVALGSGTYRFEVPDGNNRQLVRVTNKAGTQVYGVFMTQPVSRLESSGDTSVTFKERGRNSPFPLATWFYPGQRDGHLFVYKAAARPRARARPPAKRAGASARRKVT